MRRPSRSRASGSTSAATRGRIRGSAPPTSSRSSRSSRRTSGARSAPRARSARGSARSGLPVFLYEPPERGPAFYRRGGVEELAAAARRPASSRPTSARIALDPAAGAVIVGARRPLIAFNVNLRGRLEAAREIAAAVRERGGGFPGVRALGLDAAAAGLVQVSMNVEDWEAAALHEIVARIRAEAAARGAEVVGSELVGLMPAGAAVAAAGAVLRIDGFDPSHVLELRLLDAERPSRQVRAGADRSRPARPATRRRPGRRGPQRPPRRRRAAAAPRRRRAARRAAAPSRASRGGRRRSRPAPVRAPRRAPPPEPPS